MLINHVNGGSIRVFLNDEELVSLEVLFQQHRSYMIFLYPIPFILLFISWWKNRKNSDEYKGEFI